MWSARVRCDDSGGVVIRPKVPKPTKAEEVRAFAMATHRDVSCQRCGGKCGAPNRDHRKDKSVGGVTVASNLQILGGSGTTGCHGWKTDHPAEAIAEGYAVPGYADPKEWPARRLGNRYGQQRHIWVLYDDDGGFTEISDVEAMQRMAVEQ